MKFYRRLYVLLLAFTVLPTNGEPLPSPTKDVLFEAKSSILNVALNGKASSFFIGKFVTQLDRSLQSFFSDLDRFLAQLFNKVVYISNPSFFYSKEMSFFSITSIVLLIISLVLLWFGIQQKKSRKRQQQQLDQSIIDSQKELIYFLGEVIEYRSGETGQHVKRVAKISTKLAQLRGLSEHQTHVVKIVSPLHDVGKIAIPEMILNKPAKLTVEEFAIIQSHTTIGYKMLKSSHSPYMKLAAKIAYEHHEHWDGNGYPCGKKGEEIDILSRITAVADVLDALLSKRCYKEAWPVSKVIKLFKTESGKQFDPELATLVVDNIDEFVEIIRLHSDVEGKQVQHVNK
ncbi:HD domain-containing phosphohydrolase [Vibrio sp. 99-8-1]|uniref:HD-GYP domain-containing protein n=1 Tax=Vibrio sp. 99-8-1 TaxID=2607602 RepID=UPI0014933E14|nr:HD domain-containing phosphohydrolase [Vibrio sp. 99-8-1]NOI67117.1 HD domain-containing protein [Vibrio sp. 99-8-1]